MKLDWLILTVLMIICCLLLQAGCQEESMAPQQQLSADWFQQFEQMRQTSQPTATTPTRPHFQRKSPKIEFEKVEHDFGNVGPGTNNLCLEKTEYAPGESGTLKVNYFSEQLRGQTTKYLVIHSNDTSQPEITLAVKANIMIQVDYEPKTLDLLLKRENGDCPQLTLTSIDNQPFSITSFKSTANCITADFNPSEKATKFVLQPKVDMEMLEKTLNGRIEIGLSHPECKTISVGINTLPKFKILPRSIVVRGTTSREPIVKKLRILNNYDEDFELDTVWSSNGTVKVLSNSIVRDGYELELEITPPASKNTKRIFTETFFVKTKEGQQIEIPCNVFYTKRIPSSLTAKTDDEECPTCGPKILDFTKGTVTTYPTAK